ncbi:MAG: methylmalonyl-CoA epimerase [Candidatus Eiseniibacteriota bacterium]
MSATGPSATPAPRATARGLAHVSLAVRDAEETARQYETLFGARIRSRETLADRGLLVVFLEIGRVPLELVQPLDPTDMANTVAKFLQTRGPGLHHLAFFVDDAGAALEHARSTGARLVDTAPRPGADGCRVAFLHPESTSGTLIEFVEGGPHAPSSPLESD